MNDTGGSNICFSGGAEGADLLFGKMADKIDHRVCNYSFAGHNVNCPYRWILTETQLVTADPHIIKANETLKRGSFASYKPYVKNLIRRNWFQVSNSDSVYAVSNIAFDKPDTVEGGTGWAVQMAIDTGIENIWVFDQKYKNWYIWGKDMFWRTEQPPRPKGLYAGIGTRTLTDDGTIAIMDLYNRS